MARAASAIAAVRRDRAAAAGRRRRTSAAPTSSSTRQAGPYRLLVTVRPPHAIPGVADVEVRCHHAADVHDVRIVPLPLTGPGAQFAPVPDRAARSADDPQLFTGHLWMMTAGAWQVRITGDRRPRPRDRSPYRSRRCRSRRWR